MLSRSNSNVRIPCAKCGIKDETIKYDLKSNEFLCSSCKKKKPKYKNKKIIIDNITFSSEHEGAIYFQLKMQKLAGLVIDLQLQVPYLLIEPQKEILGGTNRGIKYIADFVVTMKDGTVRVIDAKGFLTAEYKLKRTLMAAIHKIKIEEL